jgi:hypothetical protein
LGISWKFPFPRSLQFWQMPAIMASSAESSQRTWQSLQDISSPFVLSPSFNPHSWKPVTCFLFLWFALPRVYKMDWQKMRPFELISLF